jgi:hypothetical protein
MRVYVGAMRIAGLVFTVCCVFLASASSAQANAPVASIRTVPVVPVEGEPVELIGSSPGRGISYSWDLDGDGTFGDAAGATVRKTLPVGTYTVGVRATDGSGRTSTETRSVTVASRNSPPTVSIHIEGLLQVDRLERVSVLGSDEDGRIVKFELDLDGDGAYEIAGPGSVDPDWARPTWYFGSEITYDTARDLVVRARVTDDAGATSTTTQSVRVVYGTPAVTLSVYGHDREYAPVAGQPATVAVWSTRPGVKHEFDLDGDGTYEVDNGAGDTVQTAFTAGTHVVRARVTDTRGDVAEQRLTTFVYEATDAPVDRFFVRRFETSANAGEAAELTATILPPGPEYTAEWDTDGDGEFDDGTVTTPRAEYPHQSVARLTHNFGPPGVYEQRVRVSRPGRPARVFSSRVFVGARAVDPVPVVSVGWFIRGVPFGKPYVISARAWSWVAPLPTLSFDFDGDGEFDETPRYEGFGYAWTFTAPTTIAVKATAPTGETAVATAQLEPPGANRTPVASLHVAGSPGQPLRASYTIDDPDGAPCCDAAWDSDGDGAYDDGNGAFPAVTATAGEHTVGVRLTDEAGRTAFVRKTFTIDGGTASPGKPLTLKVTVGKTKLKTLLARGLTIKPGCATACRATAALSAGGRGVVGKRTASSRSFTVKLTPKARRSLRKARSVKLVVKLNASAAGGRAASASRSVKISR